MARTGRDFVTRALRITGALSVGEILDDEEANDGIQLFNDMLGYWATQSLTIPYVASAQYSTVAGQKVYSLGPGGNWNGVRPERLRSAIMRLTNTGSGAYDVPLTMLDQYQYSQVALKDIASTQSQAFYYEAQYPLGFFTLYPVPSSVFGIVLSYDTIFDEVTLDSDLSGLPKGYALAVQYNLAALLAVEYKRTLTDAAAKIAVSSLGSIKSANLRAPDAVFDPNIVGVGADRRNGWDWRLG
jgi:hypothetical protein